RVTAVELEVPGRRQRRAHVRREPDRYEAIVPAPDEERGRLEPGEPRPESFRAVRLLQVDLPRGRVERHASPRREIGAQELVDAGSDPAAARVGNETMHDGLDEPA